MVVAYLLLRVTPKRALVARERRVSWGFPTPFSGTGGNDKCTILAWVAAGLSRDRLPGDLEGNPMWLAIIAGKDDPEAALILRLQAAGAGMSLMGIMDG